jgi:WS/DGAT/MGAT family acyltransferase
MSDAEAVMWAVEKDPALRSDFCNVTILDRTPSRERLLETVHRALAAIPRLGQRVVSPPLRIVPPEWVDDPTLDLDYHVRVVAVPEPGGVRELLDLVAALAEAPFDRSRPLWEFTLVEGLADGRAAMLQKVHHTITDGVGGLRLSMALVDLERDPSPDAATSLRAEVARLGRAERIADPVTRTTPVDVLRGAAADAAGRGTATARTLLGGAANLLAHPTRLPARAADAAAMAASLRRQLVVTGHARSDVMAERSLRRRFEVASVPLEPAKAAAARLGGSVNDLYVTAVAGALGAYHRARGSHVDALRMAMPVSTRTGRDGAANRFTPARVVVPIGTVDPVERFREVQHRLGATREEAALGAAEGLAALAAPLPTALLVTLVRSQTSTIDFVASNLRGSPVPLHLAGARIDATYPFGPRTGCALNVTLLSYCGTMHLGINLDPAAIDAPDELVAELHDAFDALLAAARPRRRHHAAAVSAARAAGTGPGA